MNELADWLRAQIETRKVAAEAARGLRWDRKHETQHPGPGAWRATDDVGELWIQEADGFDEIATDRLVSPEEYRSLDPAHVAHIVANDPRDTIARCDAELAILNLHVKGEYGECVICDFGAQSCGCVGWDDWPCDTVRTVALAYAHRDGYRAEWRP